MGEGGGGKRIGTVGERGGKVKTIEPLGRETSLGELTEARSLSVNGRDDLQGKGKNPRPSVAGRTGEEKKKAAGRGGSQRNCKVRVFSS